MNALLQKLWKYFRKYCWIIVAVIVLVVAVLVLLEVVDLSGK